MIHCKFYLSSVWKIYPSPELHEFLLLHILDNMQNYITIKYMTSERYEMLPSLIWISSLQIEHLFIYFTCCWVYSSQSWQSHLPSFTFTKFYLVLLLYFTCLHVLYILWILIFSNMYTFKIPLFRFLPCLFMI